jgi:drug/metabolite transporter (DMT)-like permease
VAKPPETPHNESVLKGILFKIVSALLFALMSALVRQLGDVAPVGQMVFYRSAFAIVPSR